MFSNLLKIFTYALTIVVVLGGSVNAAPRLCDNGSRPPCNDTGGTGSPPVDFGDLIFLHRDGNGVPIPSDPVQVVDPETGLLVDGGL